MDYRVPGTCSKQPKSQAIKIGQILQVFSQQIQVQHSPTLIIDGINREIFLSNTGKEISVFYERGQHFQTKIQRETFNYSS